MTLPAMASYIEMLIDRLIAWMKNHRANSYVQVVQITFSIAQFGFNNPFLVDTKAAVIAWPAGRDLSWRYFPC
jgi:hypothetical protein